MQRLVVHMKVPRNYCYYDSQALLYHNYQKKVVYKQLQKDVTILKKLNFSKIERVLDLGCGTGNFTSLLAERVGTKGQVIAIDPDKERIEVANAANKYSNVTFLVGNEHTFPQDQYDLIFCRYVTHWIANKQAVFQNVCRNLRNGGHFALIAITYQLPILRKMTELMSKVRREEINNQLHYSSVEVYNQLATDNGLKVVLLETDFEEAIYPTPDVGLAAWEAITHGMFNQDLVDKHKLTNFKRKYHEELTKWKFPIARYILKWK